MQVEPTTFDPAEVQDVPTGDLLQNVYEGLVKWTPDNKLAPAVAASWSVSKDGRTYTFKIRPRVKFHSGKVVSADDVAYSIARGFDPKLASPVAITYLGDIVGAQDAASGKATSLSGIKVIDRSTISITIIKPKAYWLNVLTYPTAFILNKDAVNKDAGGRVTAENEDGTGPFSLTSYIPGQSIDLKANPSYWAGPPKIAGIHRPIVLNADTRHNLYVTNQLDMVDLSAGAVSADEKDPTLQSQLHFFSEAVTEYLYLNVKTYAPFKDARVRQALAYATDKNKIVSIVYDNHRDPAADVVPAGMLGSDLSFKGIPYDPAKAKALLAEAGYPGGKGLPVLQIYYGDSHPDIAKTVDILRQMYLENLGLTVQPRPLEFASLLQQEDHNVLPAWALGWSADYLDPQDYYSLLLHSNAQQDHTNYANPQFDALCDSADIEQDQGKRLALYRKAAMIVINDAPLIPLFYGKDPELVKPYVHNMDRSLMGNLPFENLTLSN
jgi:ABC-type oligopeptide transport system substrate-binding subunit